MTFLETWNAVAGIRQGGSIPSHHNDSAGGNELLDKLAAVWSTDLRKGWLTLADASGIGSNEKNASSHQSGNMDCSMAILVAGGVPNAPKANLVTEIWSRRGGHVHWPEYPCTQLARVRVTEPTAQARLIEH